MLCRPGGERQTSPGTKLANLNGGCGLPAQRSGRVGGRVEWAYRESAHGMCRPNCGSRLAWAGLLIPLPRAYCASGLSRGAYRMVAEMLDGAAAQARAGEATH